MRTVFFGTPELAVPALRALHEVSSIVGVVCQPDRPAGRGLKVREPAVKRASLELGLTVHQPTKVRTGALAQWLSEREADVAVVLAYGRILPLGVLEAPQHGCMNLHASLLPKYRGAAPINWAIVRGETETGVSLMQMTEGCDEGPVYVQRRLPIRDDTDAGALTAKVAELAATMVREDLPLAVAGHLAAVPQDDGAATLAPLIQPSHRIIDWSNANQDVTNLVRGMAPAPCAVTSLHGKRLKVLRASVSDDAAPGPAGRVTVSARRRILVASGRGTVEITRAQLEGRRALPAADLVNGRVVVDGDQFGS